jgi:hypothetical protein
MNTEQDKLLDILFVKARVTKPDTTAVEENFEIRLMASIEERRNNRALWSFWAWRLVPVFSLIVIIVGIGDIVVDPDRSNDLTVSFTSGYEENLATSLLGGG